MPCQKHSSNDSETVQTNLCRLRGGKKAGLPVAALNIWMTEFFSMTCYWGLESCFYKVNVEQ